LFTKKQTEVFRLQTGSPIRMTCAKPNCIERAQFGWRWSEFFCYFEY
jgi:hypothetical protein